MHTRMRWSRTQLAPHNRESSHSCWKREEKKVRIFKAGERTRLSLSATKLVTETFSNRNSNEEVMWTLIMEYRYYIFGKLSLWFPFKIFTATIKQLYHNILFQGWKLALAHSPMASWKWPGRVETHIILAQVAPGMCRPNLVKLGAVVAKIWLGQKFSSKLQCWCWQWFRIHCSMPVFHKLKMVWYTLMGYTNKNANFTHNIGLVNM